MREKRQRPVQIKFYVTEDERDFIRKKMDAAKMRKQSDYLRKMACDGYILNVDFSEFRELFANVKKAAVNINQIARRVNSTNNIYDEDVAELKERQERIWQLLKSMQSKLP